MVGEEMGSNGGGASKPRSRGTGSQKSRRNGSKSTTPHRSQILIVSSSSSDSQQQQQIEEEPEIQESKEEEEEEAETKRSSKSDKQKQKLQAEARKQNGNGDEEDEEGYAKKEAQKSLNALPMRRVDRIIRSEGSDFHISQEAIFLVNKATEAFIELLSKDAYSFSAKSRKNTVTYKNLSTVVRKHRKYDFLSEFVPEQIKAEDALAEAKK